MTMSIHIENFSMEGHPSNINSLNDIPNEKSPITEQSIPDFDPIDGMEFKCVSSLL